MTMEIFFAVATPYNPLGHFVLTHSTQNDNALVILNFAEQSEVSIQKTENKLLKNESMDFSLSIESSK